MEYKMEKNVLITAAILGLVSIANASETKSSVEKKEEIGNCSGVNSCKGQGVKEMNACKGKNECSGNMNAQSANECKGKGITKLSEKECLAKKGSFKKI
jgi:hypothetical protein